MECGRLDFDWGCMAIGVGDDLGDSAGLAQGLPIKLIAVDPGEEHVGYAFFQSAELVHADTHHPVSAVELLWQHIEEWELDVVVAETWRNYDHKPVTWSECRTAEVNGALRHMCARHGVEFVTQPATIKRPAIARMERYGAVFPKGTDVHARDAIKHGYWYLYNHGLTPGQNAC